MQQTVESSTSQPIAGEVETTFTSNKLLTEPELPVRVLSCMGSASNKFGNDGDFYVDEMANILYGPKKDGVWPEDGFKVTGPIICKRTFIQLNATRRHRMATQESSRKKRGIFRAIYSFIKLYIPIGSGRVMSLNVEREYKGPAA